MGCYSLDASSAVGLAVGLADGWIRYRIARLSGAEKVKIRVREFETDKEAYEDALVISHNLNTSLGETRLATPY